MKEMIVKRYVKALFENFGDDRLNDFLSSLNKISSLYGMEKFKTILQSPDVEKQTKEEFVLSCVDQKDKEVVNFIKLLSSNDRLLLIPNITKELQRRVSQRDNIYEGELISDWDISKEEVKKLENGFGKKFGATVKLNVSKGDYPGIKIAIDGLGVEASFSVDRLKAQITEHILKAI
ncbi:MAG: ATP synthase F1 subunit delta [Proteobacteria bacterium]|nr:MAG: ATP synthase F1 subunit delta [Pseudomonadota bacterium]